MKVFKLLAEAKQGAVCEWLEASLLPTVLQAAEACVPREGGEGGLNRTMVECPGSAQRPRLAGK